MDFNYGLKIGKSGDQYKPILSGVEYSSMAINASTCSPALLYSKSYHALSFPRSDPHPSFPKFDRCSFSTSRQNHPPSLSTNASLLRAKAHENTRQPMLPPYNVLITGSTKGHPPLFIHFLFWFFCCTYYYYSGFCSFP